MTVEDFTYIFSDILGYDVSSETNPLPLKGARYFNENRFVSVDRNRYQVDIANELLKLYHCKPTKLKEADIPADWEEYKNYDIIDGVVYKYLCDNGEPIIDYIDIESLDVVGIDDTEDA